MMLHHEHDLKVIAIDKAVNDYDERLVFGRHQQNGDYILAIKMGPDDLHPVLGFGMERPEQGYVLQRLQSADSLRNPGILDAINRHNRAQDRVNDHKWDEHIGNVAEHMEFEMRKNAGTKGNHWSPK